MPENPECAGDAAAYVLGALDPAELDAFHAHMLDCRACRQEVEALAVVADALPLAAPQYVAPRALKHRVMTEVRADRPAAAARARSGPRSNPLAAMRPGFARSAWARPAFLAGAAVLLLAVVIGAVALSSGTSSSRTVQASVGWPGSAELRLSGGRGELVIRRMPPAPAGKVYEVWVKRGARAPEPTSALFDVTSNGTAEVGVPGDLRGVNTVMVTPEPLGGSAAPTHAAVLVARI